MKDKERKAGDPFFEERFEIIQKAVDEIVNIKTDRPLTMSEEYSLGLLIHDLKRLEKLISRGVEL